MAKCPMALGVAAESGAQACVEQGEPTVGAQIEESLHAKALPVGHQSDPQLLAKLPCQRGRANTNPGGDRFP
jgi:hypothetical protein